MTKGISASARWHTAVLYAWVAAGSILGGLTRYLVSLALDTGPGFPWATLFINVTGSLIIGFYATLTGPDGRLMASPRQRQFVMTGFCGGYTTFSAFSLETFRLFHGSTKYTALAYMAASVICWLSAVWLGHFLASRFNRLKRS
ncbi:MAG: fluoride efflux transporter CrcB [Bradyrhizobium sp.]|uniref:fluoride efflux transporter CrcB n=1 Tax=Bradyrhizobium sp. TaxID=376 RepID=UPI0025C1C224|nr:fluoride efflux transporter CrcB [Bradyrhizobium sp.]MBI5260556.1 fluoride efflux transporter CrcB [Bradyrhizobium sp.]